MRSRIPLLLLLAAVLASGAGCGLLRSMIAEIPVLVTVDARGGECPQGTCSARWEILRDGRVTSTGQPVPAIDAATMARLTEAIDGADWSAILARPFTGECPTAFDGQELTYTFQTAGGPVVVASCTTLIDSGQEPFNTIEAALFGVGG